jgi:hypothetical protein
MLELTFSFDAPLEVNRVSSEDTQAQLQGSNLGCSEEGREILASVQSLRSAPSVRGAFRPNFFC